MQPALSTRIPDGFMAAIWLGSEKPHQGVSSGNRAWHPAPNVCNSTTAIGLRSGRAGNRVRSFCSGEQYDPDLGLYYLRARYYNPATGRFLSRDPKDGYINVPKTLHKYLYADGDPVNMKDPTGKGALFEAALVTAFVIQETAPTILAAAIGICTALEYEDLLEDLWTFGKSAWTGELPEGPDEEDILKDLAAQYCATIK